jgi:ABC-type enterobactin transport system permease subunit
MWNKRAIAARGRVPLAALADETGAVPLVTDASHAAAVDALFDAAAVAPDGSPDVGFTTPASAFAVLSSMLTLMHVAHAVDVTAIAAFRVT